MLTCLRSEGSFDRLALLLVSQYHDRKQLLVLNTVATSSRNNTGRNKRHPS